MKRWIELLFYVSVGAGMALATSVFTMVGGLFAVANLAWIVISVLLAGVFCAGISLSIGELASMYPSAPGIRTYFKAAFGEFPSLVAIYLYLAFAIIVAGLESFVFATVVGFVAPSFPQQVTVLMLLLAVVAINLLGFRLPRGLQIAATVGAVALVLTASVQGVFQVRPDLEPQFASAWAGGSWGLLSSIVGMSIFLFTGFEWVTPLGLRPSAYRIQIPLSMLLGILLLTIVYLAFVLGAAAQLPSTSLAVSVAPQVLLFRQLYGGWGSGIGLGLSILAIFSTFNAGMLGGAQLVYMLAREGALPSWCGSLSPRTGCPTGAILLLGVLATVSSTIVLTFHLQIAVALVGAAIMCGVYAGFVLCGLRLRRTRPSAVRKFPNPLPYGCQILLALVLAVVSVQTLFSDADNTVPAAAGLVLAVTVACLLAIYSASTRADLRKLATTDQPEGAE
jgi:amino acid transporter